MSTGRNAPPRPRLSSRWGGTVPAVLWPFLLGIAGWAIPALIGLWNMPDCGSLWFPSDEPHGADGAGCALGLGSLFMLWVMASVGASVVAGGLSAGIGGRVRRLGVALASGALGAAYIAVFLACLDIDIDGYAGPISIAVVIGFTAGYGLVALWDEVRRAP